MAIEFDYVKLQSDERIGTFAGPSGAAFGIQDLDVPTEAEINNTGGISGMIPLAQSISWSDTELPGVRDSEVINEPSMADPATYQEFGPTNYDGSISFFLPDEYDDNSNMNSVVYDLTKTMREVLDFAVRIDGDIDALAPAEDGQYVSTNRMQIRSEANPFNFDESIRRTINLSGKGGFAHYTIVGDHDITIVMPPGSISEGDKGRILAEVQGRDYTNAVTFSSSDPEVLQVYPGGFFEAVGAGTATLTVRDRDAGTSETESITVA